MQKVVIPDRDPAASQRPQAVSERSGGVHRLVAGRGRDGPGCPPKPAACRKAEADEGSSRLVGGEVGSVKAGELADDLLRWKPPGADDHIVACDGLGIDSSHGTDDVAAAQNERVAGDPDFSDCRHLCRGFSRAVSLVRLRQSITCGRYRRNEQGPSLRSQAEAPRQPDSSSPTSRSCGEVATGMRLRLTAPSKISGSRNACMSLWWAPWRSA